MKSRKLNVQLQSRVYKLLEKVESATQLNTVIREMQSQWDNVVKNSLSVEVSSDISFGLKNGTSAPYLKAMLI